MVDNDFPAGTVWLVGAGPGDPELLTRKAERLIRAADIIFYDALVGPDILDLALSAERVSVGKRSGRHSKDQDSINDLIVRAALAGRHVVRLKGGDPTIFGRVAEEMAALAEHGIAARICPGITAASAAAASAGISLSLRGGARQVRLVTAHASTGAALDLDWDSIADPQSTLAFYMGRAAADEIGRKLIAAGMAGDTPVLIASDVSLIGERLMHTRLNLLALTMAALDEDKPTLILVGKALATADRFRHPADLGLRHHRSEPQGRRTGWRLGAVSDADTH